MSSQEFINICGRGELNEAKQFLLENPSLDILRFVHYAFNRACSYGHLNIAQWLLQVCPTINISADNEYAFHRACLNGYLDIAQWLQSLKPYLYVIYYNADGSYKDYYIRFKEEAHWTKRKCLVWLASNESPCKKNLFYTNTLII